MKFLQLTVFVILFAFRAHAQNTPVVIINAIIHVGNQQIIEGGTLVFNNGKIVYVGTENKMLYKNAEIIDAKNKHVYPALICLNNYVGLSEIEAVRATHDFDEEGMFNPNVKSQIAYNTDSKILPTLKVNGILYVQSVPQGGLISGTSSIMKTEAWNWEDATVKANDAIHLNWPESHGMENEKQQEQIKERKNQIKNFFEQAKQYQLSKQTFVNLRLEAMRGLFNQTKKLYIHVNSAKEIIQSINFFKLQYPEIQLVLAEATEAFACINFIKQNNIPVVLSNIHSLPNTANTDIDQPFKTAFALQQAGILFAIGHKESWQTRNLMFNAGTTAAYGLSKEQALQSISLNAAKIVGIDADYGSLEIGKSASVLICEGDLLDMKTSKISSIFLDGKLLENTNEQNALNKKFLNKYNLKD